MVSVRVTVYNTFMSLALAPTHAAPSADAPLGLASMDEDQLRTQVRKARTVVGFIISGFEPIALCDFLGVRHVDGADPLFLMLDGSTGEPEKLAAIVLSEHGRLSPNAARFLAQRHALDSRHAHHLEGAVPRPKSFLRRAARILRLSA